MVAKRRIAEYQNEALREPVAPAVVLPFRPRSGDSSSAASPESVRAVRPLDSAPVVGERPTLAPSALREWLRAALLVSLAVHGFVYLAFQLRFEDDLERAAGAAASLSSNGSTTVLVEIVTTAVLPSAPSPADASEAEAAKPIPTPPSAMEAEAPPELESALMQGVEEEPRLALPEEEIAPPLKTEIASAPEAPVAKLVEEPPPMPLARQAPPKPEQPHQQEPARPSSPSQAASPTQAAGANSAGRAGAGGVADAGGRTEVSSYQARVLAHLARHRVYPPEARSRGITGVARVQFALARDGRVVSARLVDGSGERVLDEAAVAMVQRASPFPPFPAAITQAQMNFAAPIRFHLR